MQELVYLTEAGQYFFVYVIYDVPNLLMLHEAVQPKARYVSNYFSSCSVKGTLFLFILLFHLSQSGKHILMNLQRKVVSTRRPRYKQPVSFFIYLPLKSCQS